ncbi:MAG: acyltransferase [bacterium]|nr:acyltransferase [bacterium]
MKRVIKKTLFIVAVIFASPFILLTRLEEFIRHKRSARFFGASREILAIVPTIIGEYLRLAFYWGVCTEVSTDASFLFGCMLARQDTIVRGNAIIGHFCIIGHAEIEDNVLIGPRSSIISGKYVHGKPGQRIDESSGEHEFKTIKIGRDTWIGQDSVLLENVGAGCTVSAGSVVLREVPDGAIVMGNPARKVSL